MQNKVKLCCVIVEALGGHWDQFMGFFGVGSLRALKRSHLFAAASCAKTESTAHVMNIS